jgi:deoxyribodipyrimidine photo-lyase
MADHDLQSCDDWPAGTVLVQAATYNERENLPSLIEAVLAAGPELQLLIIDDSSPDGTGDVALRLAEHNARLHVLVRRGRRGLGSAILEGFRLASSRGFAVSLNMDADHSHDPTDIPRLLAALDPVGGRPAATITGSPEVYLRELGWREFASHLLFHFPHTSDAPLRADYARFPWVRDPVGLRAWQRGRTGFPVVDAGMRQLWATGWMHNRVRMVVASFLVKDLRISWLEGARWFWDTLVDADLAANTLGWQWAAGCGADAAPYFRIFNPTSQGEKFDPAGDYVRTWVPQLARLPADDIHEPAEAEAAVLAKAGVTLGRDYPEPIVDHAVARKRALEALATVTRGR